MNSCHLSEVNEPSRVFSRVVQNLVSGDLRSLKTSTELEDYQMLSGAAKHSETVWFFFQNTQFWKNFHQPVID